MGLSTDPDKRERQLAALERGRGLHDDPERRERQLSALAEGRAKRHPVIVDEQPEPAPPAPEPAPRRGRALPATYDDGGPAPHAPVRKRRRRRAAAAAPPPAQDDPPVVEHDAAGERPDRLGFLASIVGVDE